MAGLHRGAGARARACRTRPALGIGLDREHPARGPESARGGQAACERLIDEFKLTHEQAATRDRALARRRDQPAAAARARAAPSRTMLQVTGAIDMGHARCCSALSAARQVEARAATSPLKRPLGARDRAPRAGEPRARRRAAEARRPRWTQTAAGCRRSSPSRFSARAVQLKPRRGGARSVVIDYASLDRAAGPGGMRLTSRNTIAAPQNTALTLIVARADIIRTVRVASPTSGSYPHRPAGGRSSPPRSSRWLAATPVG